MTLGQALIDGARVTVGLIGAGVAIYQLYLVGQAPALGQKARLAGAAVALGVLSGARVENLGQPLTWQLPAAFIAVALLAWGSLAFRDETPARTRR